MSNITSEELQDFMSQCYGTEEWHKYALIPSFPIYLTDGVKFFCEKIEGFWFVADFYSYIPTFCKKAPEEYLFSVKLIVNKDTTADLIISDGNMKQLVKKHYTYTDCPAGEWSFLYDKDSKVLLYYLEY